jgi:hypothetical protein
MSQGQKKAFPGRGKASSRRNNRCLPEIARLSLLAMAFLTLRKILEFAFREDRSHLDLAAACALKALRGRSGPGVLAYLCHIFLLVNRPTIVGEAVFWVLDAEI